MACCNFSKKGHFARIHSLEEKIVGKRTSILKLEKLLVNSIIHQTVVPLVNLNLIED